MPSYVFRKAHREPLDQENIHATDMKIFIKGHELWKKFKPKKLTQIILKTKFTYGKTIIADNI
jgi:hypothetical protein